MASYTQWKDIRLGDVAKVISGFAFKSKDFQPEGIPIIKIKNIRVGAVDLSEVDHVDSSFLSLDTKYHVKGGDILISLTGSHLTQPNSVVGRVALHSSSLGHCLLNQRAGKIIVTKPEICNKLFLFYSIYAEEKRRKIALMALGAASQANVSPSQVESVEIKLPPLPTQRKLAAIISAYDDLIENNTRRIEILEEMARSLYREWFVNFRFPGHEQVKMIDSTSEFGLIPEGWEVLPIDELIKRGILEKNQDGNHGEKHPKSTNYVPVGIPFIMAKDLANNILNLANCQLISNEQAQSLRVGFAKKGDVLLTHKATMGRVAIVPQVENFIVLTPQVTYFRIKNSSSLNQAFLYCTFTSDRFQDILSGQSEQSTRKFISITNQRNIKILYPSPDWINKFGKIINDVLNLKQSLYSKNVNLRQTRDLLLPQLISGEIDVENIDINTGEIAA
ncbi:MAG: restriction endonuclease subunit S [Kastovskya adunca ATA6-11-RM4]|jgi:type I restriction enzyme S subunit|nr:restriction endonuclease subunit S [Kastovskya adunca ATA6-11-RM4]